MLKMIIALFLAACTTMPGCGGIYRGTCAEARLGGSYELEFIASKYLVVNIVECVSTGETSYSAEDLSTDQIIKIELDENDPHDYTVVDGWGSQFELVNDSAESVKLTINFDRPMALVQLKGDEYKIPIKGTEMVDNETISFDVPTGSSWWSIHPLY